MRLIDADVICKECIDELILLTCEGCVVKEHKLNKAIEAEPVKHSAWKRCGSVLCECQNCGEIYSMSGNLNKGWNYCPSCGAKMDLEG